MKPAISYLIIVALSVGLLFVVFRGCNSEYKDKIVFIDSSGTKELRVKLAKYDTLADHWAIENLKMEDSVKILNGRLKTAKSKFWTKYVQIKSDSLITDSNCLITLDYANQTILTYDSLFTIQSKSLTDCFGQVVSRDSVIAFLREYSAVAGKDKSTLIAELGKFKHWFWRVYWKRKN